MKILASFAFLAACAVFLAGAPFEFALTLILAAGLGAVLAQDYGRRSAPLRLPTPPRRQLQARFRPPALCVETHRLAA